MYSEQLAIISQRKIWITDAKLYKVTEMLQHNNRKKKVPKVYESYYICATPNTEQSRQQNANMYIFMNIM